MRILHVIESLEYGGAEKVAVHLANRLAHDQDVTVCLVKYRGELSAELVSNIDIVYLDLGEGLHWGLPFKLASLIANKSIDIINVHNWAIYLECFVAAKLARRGVIIQTVHGPYTAYANSPAQRVKRRLRHFLESSVSRSRQVSAIVTVSDAIQEYIHSDIGIPGEKLRTIHNGIKGVEYEPIRYEGPVRLITVGRLARIKNHGLMLTAFSECLKNGADLYLSIVGDGPERDELIARSSDLGLQDRVSFLGFRDDIIELLAAHDIFLLSSDYEGISIALLEAMSLARPAIATDVGGIPETIVHEETGLIVPRGDTSRFADAILKLAGSVDLRYRLGLQAREFFRAEFHEDKFVAEYLDLYRASMSGELQKSLPNAVDS